MVKLPEPTKILRKTEPIELGRTATEDLRLLRASSAAANLKVVRSALQNAASDARLLLTAEALITEKPEKKGTSRPAASEF